MGSGVEQTVESESRASPRRARPDRRSRGGARASGRSGEVVQLAGRVAAPRGIDLGPTPPATGSRLARDTRVGVSFCFRRYRLPSFGAAHGRVSCELSLATKRPYEGRRYRRKQYETPTRVSRASLDPVAGGVGPRSIPRGAATRPAS